MNSSSPLGNFKLDDALRSLDGIQLARVNGRLVRVSGMLLESHGCPRMTGQRCYVEQGDGSMLEAQVVGFNRDISYLMPFKKPLGLTTGSRVFAADDDSHLHIDESWLGRVLNGLGEPLDDCGRLSGRDVLPAELPRVNPLRRRPVSAPLDVGVRAINALLTLGKGQR
ncbi:MAG TPA: flagellum-specific ATP synthase FliI, partial [Dongiaceae bacterium]|nr:flagellum-specific ATP synthase FliI [Dongiaceae bacterium]